MTDIGAVWKRSAVAERAVVFGSIGFAPTAGSAQASLGSVLPLPRNNVGRRMADWAAGTAEAVRAMFRTTAVRPSEPERRHYPPRRESYIEDAAMSREMYRL
jgi:hypothetical protein